MWKTSKIFLENKIINIKIKLKIKDKIFGQLKNIKLNKFQEVIFIVKVFIILRITLKLKNKQFILN